MSIMMNNKFLIVRAPFPFEKNSGTEIVYYKGYTTRLHRLEVTIHRDEAMRLGANEAEMILAGLAHYPTDYKWKKIEIAE